MLSATARWSRGRSSTGDVSQQQATDAAAPPVGRQETPTGSARAGTRSWLGDVITPQRSKAERTRTRRPAGGPPWRGCEHDQGRRGRRGQRGQEGEISKKRRRSSSRAGDTAGRAQRLSSASSAPPPLSLPLVAFLRWPASRCSTALPDDIEGQVASNAFLVLIIAIGIIVSTTGDVTCFNIAAVLSAQDAHEGLSCFLRQAIGFFDHESNSATNSHRSSRRRSQGRACDLARSTACASPRASRW